MLSVCIPVYNFDVRELVETLSSQIEQLDVECNLILIDDCSKEEYRKINSPVCSKHKYIELPENIGRSKIRNLFLKYTEKKYLLFLDCDIKINSINFLSNYINFIKNNPTTNVICGGLVYRPVESNRSSRLRWKYGMKRESRDIEIRLANPSKSFLSSNFVVLRDIFIKYPFNEDISGYGHEDTFFGYTLMKNNIHIDHIDNPILIDDIEENESFLNKTSESMRNLLSLAVITNYDKDFIEISRVLKTYFELKKKNLIPLIRLSSFFTRKPIYFLLKKGYSSNLFLFDLLKLYVLDEEYKTTTCRG